MAITYTWKITSLRKTNGSSISDVIVGTNWQCKGTDANGNYGTFDGATPFELSKVDPENFTAYEDLTEEMVLGWIKTIVVGSYWDHVNEQIMRQIELKKNPVVEVNHMPWAPAVAPAAPIVDPVEVAPVAPVSSGTGTESANTAPTEE